MRLFTLSLSLALIAAAPATAAEALSVPLGQAVKVTLSRSAEKVAVGSDKVVDVTVIDSRTLLLTGKSYGLTNVLAFDARGGTLIDQQINVAAPASGGMTVYADGDKVAYACNPRCGKVETTAAPPAPSGILATPPSP